MLKIREGSWEKRSKHTLGKSISPNVYEAIMNILSCYGNLKEIYSWMIL
jgi:hypothetical protein